MQMSLGHFVGQWLEILRKLSHQKLECRKAPSCKIQGMLEWLEGCVLHCCMLAGYSLLLSGTSERVQITLCIIIQTIQIEKYFELMLRITTYFKLNPCVNLN